MKPQIVLGIGDYTFVGSDHRSVVVNVKNVGRCPISTVKVEFVCTYEVAQDVTSEFQKRFGDEFIARTGKKPVSAREKGQRWAFAPDSEPEEHMLKVGATRAYLLPFEQMTQLQSLVQALSPECFHLAITLDGQETVAIPGPDFGEFVQRRFG